MVADVVSWFKTRENDRVGVPQFTKPSIASIYFMENKSLGFVCMQIRQGDDTMYSLPLTKSDWADFVSIANEHDMRAYDRLVNEVIEQTDLYSRVDGEPLKWFQLKKKDNFEEAKNVAELLLMVRLV